MHRRRPSTSPCHSAKAAKHRSHRPAMAAQAHQARSLYRRILRELPARSPSLLANPSPVQQHIRREFASDQPSKLREGEQYVHYLRAQRMYTTLLERYNPGMNMNEEERVRLTARRVGMDLPVEWMQSGGGKKEE